MSIDKRDKLKEAPFDYQHYKNGKVQVFFKGKPITLLIGKDVEKLLRVEASGDDDAIQLFLAKVTGHFKHGNEKLKR